MKKQSNNNDSDKIMGLSEEKRFTLGMSSNVVVSFVFSEHGFVYFHPFVLFTHSLWKKCEEMGGDDEKSTKLCQECAISET